MNHKSFIIQIDCPEDLNSAQFKEELTKLIVESGFKTSQILLACQFITSTEESYLSLLNQFRMIKNNIAMARDANFIKLVKPL